MARLTREVRINASKEKVWDTLADFGNTYKFNPTVSSSHSTSGAPGGLGATRHCDLSNGSSSLEERIVGWEEGRSMVIDIYDGKGLPPFATAQATLSVRQAGSQTIVSGTLEYKLKFGPVGVLMDRAMVKPQFAKSWEGVLAGLKHHCETGETVEKPAQIDYAPVMVPA